MMAPWEIALFVIMGVAVVWAFFALIMLGRALNMPWGRLAWLSVMPIVVLALFITSGVFGVLDAPYFRERLVLPLVISAIFLPWPMLVTLMVRAARRLHVGDGRAVAEVFR